jgi:hydroxymethylpyrimidine kinase/phosphomethylpyrimidine kinase
MKTVMTVAGSDPSGGAGIQADLKTITALGAYGTSVLTALTAQNTAGVEAVFDVPPDFIRAQFTAVAGDIGLDAAKTGMLSRAKAVETVADLFRTYPAPILVVDPVMTATSGQGLLSPEATGALITRLLPLATLVTPNLPEASVLAGFEVNDETSMVEAARKIRDLGPGAVLVKGGHLAGDPVDVLFDGQEVHRFPGRRLETKNTHGTGCVLSAALATLLAQGFRLVEAVERARAFLRRAMLAGPGLGAGRGPTDPLAGAAGIWAERQAISAVETALRDLARAGIGRLIPEVRANLGYALEEADTDEDVIAVPGRISNVGDEVIWQRPPRPGASRHIAHVIRAARSIFPELRSAMNVRFSPEIVAAGRDLGYDVREFSRADEPPEVKAREGGSLEWGTLRALEGAAAPPDLVFDRGDVGKEPMVRVLGRDPIDVARKIIALAGRLKDFQA